MIIGSWRHFGCRAVLLVVLAAAAAAQATDPLAELVQAHQRDLAEDGRTFMKDLFIRHYRAAARDEAKPKFIVVFGQSHLGRGIDRRGVSTLGNFIAELAAAECGQSFHVLLFAAGGKYSLGGLHDIDQTKDEPGFAYLASLARSPAAVFDVRPLRPVLHRLPPPLTPRDANLLSWADAYDAIVCYRAVTPVGAPGK